MQVPEIPLVVDDSAEGLKKTKGALALLVKVGAIADAEKAKASRNIRCEVAQKLTQVHYSTPDRAGHAWHLCCRSAAACTASALSQLLRNFEAHSEVYMLKAQGWQCSTRRGKEWPDHLSETLANAPASHKLPPPAGAARAR